NGLSPGNSGVLVGTNNNAYAFITDGSGNLVDFAAVDGSSHIVGATTVTGLSAPNFAGAGNPNTGNSGNVNLLENGAAIIDFSQNVSTGMRNNSGTVVIGNGIRFNTPRTDGAAWQLDTGSAGRAFQTGGILVTSNVGATNITTLTAGGFIEGRTSDLVF